MIKIEKIKIYGLVHNRNFTLDSQKSENASAFKSKFIFTSLTTSIYKIKKPWVKYMQNSLKFKCAVKTPSESSSFSHKF